MITRPAGGDGDGRHVAPVPESAEEPSLGRCCHCEREGPGVRVRSFVLLGVRSPKPGDGCWGCLQCGLPMAGAIAVLCDECLEHGLPAKLACLGPPGANRRVPIEQLTELFEHDMSKHPEVVAREFLRNNAKKGVER